MATIDECIEFALKNIGLWWRYGISRHCDEWKYIIIGRIFESEIILIPPSNSLKISESSSNGSYRNTDEVWWRYGISRSCDECLTNLSSCPSLPPLILLLILQTCHPVLPSCSMLTGFFIWGYMYPFTFIFGGTSKFLGVQRKLTAFSPHKVVHHAVFL